MKRKILFGLQMLLMLPIMAIFGAIKVKGAEASAEKWRNNAGRAADSYGAGAAAAAEDWARNTAAAKDTFGQAVAAAGVKERYQRGVQRAGAAKYLRKVQSVGQDRYAPGVAAAEGDYQEGAAPYLQAIAGLTLSPRKPRGDPANYRRVEEVGKALNAKRLAMLGTGG